MRSCDIHWYVWSTCIVRSRKYFKVCQKVSDCAELLKLVHRFTLNCKLASNWGHVLVKHIVTLVSLLLVNEYAITCSTFVEFIILIRQLWMCGCL